MSAERLREAARVLRERAEIVDKAEAAPGPWVVEDDNFSEYTTVIDVNGWRVTEGPDQFYRPVAAYIATMHPGVGLALADWLEMVGAWIDEGLGLIPPDINIGDAWADVEGQAHKVTDLILGDAS